VGGLLEVSSYGASTTNSFTVFDGNGNIAALVNAADGTSLAGYEYGPFGEVIRSTGPMAKANPFRFSTEYYDDETDLVNYPFRPYSPSQGRFLTRDLIEEKGGKNLYGFVQNSPVGFVDFLGLKTISFRFAGDALIDVFNLGEIDGQIDTVKTVLSKCKCQDVRVDYEWYWYWSTDQMPSDGKWVFNRDHALAKKTWDKIGHAKIPVILTGRHIFALGGQDAGLTYTGEGTIMDTSLMSFYFNPRTLAHELGHYAGYVGDAPGHHSSHKDNIMYPGDGVKNALNPDDEYCTKVLLLAK
jgi:RHS repeat-associated protein